MFFEQFVTIDRDVSKYTHQLTFSTRVFLLALNMSAFNILTNAQTYLLCMSNSLFEICLKKVLFSSALQMLPFIQRGAWKQASISYQNRSQPSLDAPKRCWAGTEAGTTQANTECRTVRAGSSFSVCIQVLVKKIDIFLFYLF